MKIRIRILATALFLFVASSFLIAQDKYDIAIVGYLRDVPKGLIVVSINGDKFETTEVEREELGGKQWGVDLNPLLKKVNKMQDMGWEIVGGMVNSGLPEVSLFYYSMRKKRN